MSVKEQTYTRRGFLNRLWVALGAITVVELIALVVSFFRPRPPRIAGGAAESIFIAGPVDRFEAGSVTAFVQGRFYLARLDDGGFLALSRRCTHLSCTVPWVAAEQRFICPCHSSAFDIRGDVVNPPAPRALDLHPLTIENGVIRVDTSRTFKRAGFSAGQATYADRA
jgi:cytochrome b6-f complex iron-sulfur subunit